jgi:SHS2 domain-containing protein
MTKLYEVIEHTADIGIRVKGKDLKELFSNAGLSLFDIAAEKKPIRDKKNITIGIEVKGDTREELFINWLNELLFLFATRQIIFTHFRIHALNEHSLKALATATSVRNYRVNTEIKAATYHMLKIRKQGSGWDAEVILDV